jgi:hypothetical protein
MNSQELRALQQAYSQVYELDESAIGDKARNAVADQRLNAAQKDTQSSIDKLKKGNTVTRAGAHIAAKRVEADVRKSSSYGPQRPKPGTTGAYRITDSFDVYDVILSHLLDEGYADTQEQAQVIMVNMSEDWREDILEGLDMKTFKANRRNTKRREASADAKSRGHVSKNIVTHGKTYSSDEAKSGRANMSDNERATRKSVAMNPDQVGDTRETADKTKNTNKLRKQKAMGELG